MKKLLIPLLLMILVLSGCEKKEDLIEPVTVIVSFETNEGTAVDSVTVDMSTEYTIEAVTTKEGYTFIGWYTDELLTTLFVDGTTIVENTTVYAAWEIVETNVLFYYGDLYLGGWIVTYGEEVELPPATIPTYTFIGWYTEATFENEITDITGTTENRRLYGKFEPTPIEVVEEGTIDLETLPYYSYLSETNPVITITVKDIGTMTLQLFPDVAQNSVDNMIAYIVDGDYTNSPFHRVIENFMIQGGIVEETNCEIAGEFSSNGIENDLSHFRGILSMARTSVLDSGTSQFFIVHADSDFLDGNYATFGGLVSGFNVLDFIATDATDSSDAPYRDITIESITVELNGYVPGTVICAE